MSFRLKTILGIAAIEIFVLLVLGLTNYTKFGGIATETFLQRTQKSAQLVADMSAGAVIGSDIATLHAMAEHVMKNGDYHYIRFRNADGVELSVAGRPEDLNHQPEHHDSIQGLEGHDHFDVTAPIAIDGKSYGTVELGIALSGIRADLHNASLWNLGVSAAAMLVVSLFGWLFGSYLTHQLQILRDGAIQLSKNTRDFRIPLEGDDELAQTAACLNEMAESLNQERTELEAREKETRQLRMVAELANESIVISDHENRILWANKGFTDITGYTLDEVVNRPAVEVFNGPDTDPRKEQALLAALSKGQRFNAEIVAYTKSRVPFWIDLSITPMMSEGLNQFIIVGRDITGRKEAEAELDKINAAFRFQALRDPLTGLGNRRYLDNVLDKTAAKCSRTGQALALLHIDLDRFKQINDTLGHAAGDHVLLHVSDILKAKAQERDEIARVGGDEFVIASMNADPDYLTNLANELLEALQEPVPFEHHLCRFGASIGIATASGSRIDPKALMVNADIALYRVKETGRNGYEFFSEKLHQQVIERKQIADDILRAIENSEFIPFYQPQIDIHTQEIVGAEALARWFHPERGILVPPIFLGVAEDLNVAARIDEMIMEKALADRERWNASGLTIPKISVNISARRLCDPELIPKVRQQTIEKGTLSFEILETIFIDNDDGIIAENISGLKELGIDIEVDDFGTGHASITSLLQLKPRRLKVDRQLITPITQSIRQQHLVEAIIAIGSSLGIEVTVEGVETSEQLALLSRMGCQTVQGYYYSPPLPADKFEQYVIANARQTGTHLRMA